eukprot:15479859-Alexandrium_andersonii.AAC.1
MAGGVGCASPKQGVPQWPCGDRVRSPSVTGRSSGGRDLLSCAMDIWRGGDCYCWRCFRHNPGRAG